MKLLVTGGLGFIGSNFIRFMLVEHDNCTIVNVDAKMFGSNAENLKDLNETDRYSFVHGNIVDTELIPRLIKDVHAVASFAAETHVDRSIRGPANIQILCRSHNARMQDQHV